MSEDIFHLGSCPCREAGEKPVADIQKGGHTPAEGLPHLKYWAECTKCHTILQEWTTREEAAMAEHHFATMMMRRLAEAWRAEDEAKAASELPS